jgi:hypothetical protein
MWQGARKVMEHLSHRELGARVGLFIAKDQRSYYNVVTVLSYLPR